MPATQVDFQNLILRRVAHAERDEFQHLVLTGSAAHLHLDRLPVIYTAHA